MPNWYCLIGCLACQMGPGEMSSVRWELEKWVLTGLCHWEVTWLLLPVEHGRFGWPKALGACTYLSLLCPSVLSFSDTLHLADRAASQQFAATNCNWGRSDEICFTPLIGISTVQCPIHGDGDEQLETLGEEPTRELPCVLLAEAVSCLQLCSSTSAISPLRATSGFGPLGAAWTGDCALNVELMGLVSYKSESNPFRLLSTSGSQLF